MEGVVTTSYKIRKRGKDAPVRNNSIIPVVVGDVTLVVADQFPGFTGNAIDSIDTL